MRRPSPAHASRAALAAALLGCSGAAGAQAADHAGRIALRLETELRESNLASDAPRPTFARGDTVSGRQGRETTLEGEAEIRRAGTVIRADRLTLYEADDEVVAIGNVRVAREGIVFTGPQLQLKLDANEGSFASPRFYLPLTGGSGRAERIDFLGRGEVEMHDATSTGTCAPRACRSTGPPTRATRAGRRCTSRTCRSRRRRSSASRSATSAAAASSRRRCRCPRRSAPRSASPTTGTSPRTAT
jgi:lipopolysaccharide assembly outer membrane protein LptD (OstA)